jgi:SAM-dependent methyltransferase
VWAFLAAMSVTIIDRLLSFRKRWAGGRFDRLHGVETNREVSRASLTEMPDEILADAGDYVPTHPALFKRIVRTSGIDPSGFTFVDLGCGKGRVLIAAAQYPFKVIIGVEVDGSLCEIAKQNLKGWRQGRSDGRVEIIHADVRAFEWPRGNLFIFMYSPFRGSVFKSVADRITKIAADPGRAVVIAYSADWEAEALEETGCFTRLPMTRRQFWARSTVSLFYNETSLRLRR